MQAVANGSPSTLRGVELAWIGERGGTLAVAGARHGLPVHGHRVVDAHDHEVAGVGSAQGGLDRGHLVQDLVDPERPAGPLLFRDAYAVGDERGRRARLAPAEVAVLAHDDLVERPGGEGAV